MREKQKDICVWGVVVEQSLKALERLEKGESEANIAIDLCYTQRVTGANRKALF